jgi:hypothetical protein
VIRIIVEKAGGVPSVEARKRHAGFAVIAVLWLLGSVNLYASLITIIQNQIGGMLIFDHVSRMVTEWLERVGQAERAISLLVFALGLVQMFTVYELWTGKSWSYKLALAVSTLVAISWLSMIALYMSALANREIFLPINVSRPWYSLAANIFWMIVCLRYL